MTGKRLRDAVITPHAAIEARRRGIPLELVRSVLHLPEQEFELRPGRTVLQSRVQLGERGAAYLLRVIVDVDRRPAAVVTVYRTSKIGKYWRSES